MAKVSKNSRTGRGKDESKKMTKVIRAFKTKNGSYSFKDNMMSKDEADQLKSDED
jgi:hypothetical protein